MAAFWGLQMLNLEMDEIFYLTAGGVLPYWTSGFIGTTDAKGNATAGFCTPWLGVGAQVYVGAIAFNSQVPGGCDVGNMEVIKVK